LFYTYEAKGLIGVYKLDRDKMTYYAGFGNRGRGPYEFTYTDYLMTEDTLYLANSTPSGIQAMCAVPLDDMRSVSDYSRWKVYDLSTLPPLLKFNGYAKVGASKFLMLGGKGKSKELLSIINVEEKTVTPVDYWIDDDVNCSLLTKQMIYGNASLSVNGDKILYTGAEGWRFLR